MRLAAAFPMGQPGISPRPDEQAAGPPRPPAKVPRFLKRKRLMSEASTPHAQPFRPARSPAPQSVRCPCCPMVIPIAMNGKPKNLLPKHMCEHHHTQHGHPLYDHTSIARMKHLVTLCDNCGSAYCPGSIISHLDRIVLQHVALV